MNERKEPASLRDLDSRLERARAEADAAAGRTGRRRRSGQSGLGFGLRIGVELVSALAVGGIIGLLLDRWLGTEPWLMVVFFLLGAAAGLMNVYRVMTGLGQSVGYPREKTEDDDKRSPDD